MNYPIKFSIQSPLDTKDDVGGYTREWEIQGYAWGNFLGTTGRGGDFSGEKRQYLYQKIVFKDIGDLNIQVGWLCEAAEQKFEIVSMKNQIGLTIEILARMEVDHVA